MSEESKASTATATTSTATSTSTSTATSTSTSVKKITIGTAIYGQDRFYKSYPKTALDEIINKGDFNNATSLRIKNLPLALNKHPFIILRNPTPDEHVKIHDEDNSGHDYDFQDDATLPKTDKYISRYLKTYELLKKHMSENKFKKINIDELDEETFAIIALYASTVTDLTININIHNMFYSCIYYMCCSCYHDWQEERADDDDSDTDATETKDNLDEDDRDEKGCTYIYANDSENESQDVDTELEEEAEVEDNEKNNSDHEDDGPYNDIQDNDMPRQTIAGATGQYYGCTMCDINRKEEIIRTINNYIKLVAKFSDIKFSQLKSFKIHIDVPHHMLKLKRFRRWLPTILIECNRIFNMEESWPLDCPKLTQLKQTTNFPFEPSIKWTTYFEWECPKLVSFETDFILWHFNKKITPELLRTV